MLSEALYQKILKFRIDRDWEQFHTLRTLSTSLVLETAELAEITQWAKDSELDEVARLRRPEIEHEVADIVILLTYLIHDLGIDVEQAVAAKLEFNAARYPVDRARGSAKKYDNLD
jgi:NTP pyrophosphatase (non-canonical NTP hydrolase)